MYGQYGHNMQPETTVFDATVTALTQAGMQAGEAVSMTLEGIWLAERYGWVTS
jgi:hypothetical protein